jgi:hypothetical protein
LIKSLRFELSQSSQVEEYGAFNLQCVDVTTIPKKNPGIKQFWEQNILPSLAHSQEDFVTTY